MCGGHRGKTKEVAEWGFIFVSGPLIPGERCPTSGHCSERGKPRAFRSLPIHFTEIAKLN